MTRTQSRIYHHPQLLSSLLLQPLPLTEICHSSELSLRLLFLCPSVPISISAFLCLPESYLAGLPASLLFPGGEPCLAVVAEIPTMGSCLSQSPIRSGFPWQAPQDGPVHTDGYVPSFCPLPHSTHIATEPNRALVTVRTRSLSTLSICQIKSRQPSLAPEIETQPQRAYNLLHSLLQQVPSFFL